MRRKGPIDLRLFFLQIPHSDRLHIFSGFGGRSSGEKYLLHYG
jgi:hypothetical protein